MDAQKIKDLISRNQWETVFITLKKIKSNDENWDSQVVQLESRYRYLKTQKAQGVLTTDEVNLEFNRLRESILSLVQELPPPPPPPFIKWLIIVGVVIFGVVGLALYLSDPTLTQKPQSETLQQKNFLEGHIHSNWEDLESVEIRIMGTSFSTFTNSKGMFKLNLPLENLRESYMISLYKKGYQPGKETYYMNSNEFIINLPKDK